MSNTYKQLWSLFVTITREGLEATTHNNVMERERKTPTMTTNSDHDPQEFPETPSTKHRREGEAKEWEETILNNAAEQQQETLQCIISLCTQQRIENMYIITIYCLNHDSCI